MNNKISEMKNLISQLNQASELYYNGKESPISDKQWDKLFDELKELEKETNTILSNSPTQKVGYTTLSKLEKVRHTSPMLSLQKTKSVTELQKFLGNKEGVLSYKLDGLTVVLTYDNGKLIKAVTRGNGEIGSDITHHARMFTNIPQTISYKYHLIIRGEALIKLTDFEEINADDIYVNARNLASGTLNSLDNKFTKERKLSFIAFGIVESNKFFDYVDEQFLWLSQIGFDVVPYQLINKDTVTKYTDDMSNDIQKNKIFPCDGLVLIYNNIDFGNSLGITSHHPLNGIAFKWEDNTVETTLRDIKFQVGRTGKLTPVAMFDTVDLEGSKVSKASLHNLSILRALELGFNDNITVYKANMIIPQVDDNLTRSNNFVIPTHCPICHSKLEIENPNGSEFLMCNNTNCGGRHLKEIEHYCSKNAMDIEGFSEATIQLLLENGIISNIFDIYELNNDEKRNQMLALPRMGKKKVDNLINAIEKSKNCTLSQFIYALGIPNIGRNSTKNLIAYVKEQLQIVKMPSDSKSIVNNIMYSKPYQFINVKDFGEITDKSIHCFFDNPSNLKMVTDLLIKHNFIDDEEETTITDNADSILNGKLIYCTGTFACGKKNDLKAMVENNGGIFANGYAKSLDMLVIGSLKGSSKEGKAISDGVKVMQENEFLELIERRI